MKRLEVLDSFMTYREVGSGAPIVLLHGNPTSSYVWRNVMPALPGRVLAPDLIGMGESGKPKIDYRYRDHVRYLDAWFEAMDLRDCTLVGYDWGAILALDWARRHEDRVRRVAVFETFLQELHFAEFPPTGAQLFRALRTPGVGEGMVLEKNEFLGASLGHGVKHGLGNVDRAAYFAPFPTPESRRPMLQFPRELPIDGEPADVVQVLADNAKWLAANPKLPKLLLTFEGGQGMSNSPALVAWAKASFANLGVEHLPEAGHHAPEDQPTAIADAITRFVQA